MNCFFFSFFPLIQSPPVLSSNYYYIIIWLPAIITHIIVYIDVITYIYNLYTFYSFFKAMSHTSYHLLPTTAL